jgi:hypothetical protein
LALATFYFKHLVIIVLFELLTIQVGSAQDSQVKKPTPLKLDAQKRAYYIDQDGDKVIVLDYKTRRSLQAVSSYKKENLDKTKMYPKTFYKESVPDSFDRPKSQFKTYSIEEGDTWESVSMKIYDTEDQWAQLKLWNEELQKDPKLPAGAEMKYLDLPKK